MSHKALDSRPSIESCTFQLHTWRPFKFQPKTLDYSDSHLATTTTNPSYSKPYHHYSANGVHTKRPCLSDRATSFSVVDAAAIDMSKLTLIEDDRPISTGHHNRVSFGLFARKRRRRGSRSVSGRSSDRSITRRCCSVGASAAYGTCSDLPVTDSSGELFGNGDANWASDVSEARNSRRDKDGGGSGEKETTGHGFGPVGGFDAQGNESGYGSEPGYRGDAEFGYGDELDEEEDDAKLLFWGERFGAEAHSKMEMVGENTFSDQKTHYRCRRKKHDCRMVDSPR
ncbi:uncharacterized protein LOC121260627 isoform X1 [Juglans microcarpa x Juglans regia]|uniref:uncharacterized protein LOC121260627 isoform X1 n=1 Tax=Juglans microcarpa x Juglans regia TaxID=2249226 RepID=UPI001B7ECD83|nr:uncharacterized protein LOC121260627 isoform X1 [Juglans microcarpa x Juglans regia]